MFLGRTWAAVCSAPGFWTRSWLFVARNPNPVFGTLIQLVVVKKSRLCKPENWMCSFGVFSGALGFLQRFTGFPGGVFCLLEVPMQRCRRPGLRWPDLLEKSSDVAVFVRVLF